MFCDHVSRDWCGSSSAVAADRVAQQPFGQVRLMDKACTKPEIVAQILPQYVAQFKAGKGVVTDKAVAKAIGKDTFDFCWTLHEGAIALVDEFGGSVALDPADFAEAKGGA
jgi:hypothetical protein